MSDLSRYSDEELMKVAGLQSMSDDDLMKIAGIGGSKAPASAPAKEKSISGFVGNIGQDVGDIATGLYSMVRHPVDTLTGMRDIVAGAGGELRNLVGLPANPYLTPEGRVKAAEAFAPIKTSLAKSINEPSSIPGRVLDYAYEKPVTTALMASQGLGMASKGATAANAPRLAAGLQTAETVTNPINLVTKAPVKAVSKLAKETIGTMTGAGPGWVEQAVKGSPDFTQALRGNITGEEVVNNAKGALQTLRDNRGAAYRDKLAEVTANQMPIDLTPISQKLEDLMKRFNIKVTAAPDGTLNMDTSRVAMGRKGVRDLQDVIKTIGQWGKQAGDNTAVGLDVLKRKLDDFYSESSQARAFVADMRKTVNDTIGRNVPEYAEMTKGYAEASKLISDIESNLMLRKEGMTGRITADNTLRRLSSALRENFEMRKDLLNTLGTESGVDVAAQVAGYLGNQWLPRGGLAKLGVGGSLYYFHLFNPQLWPILAASSPRVMGEFLNAFGKAAYSTGMSKVAEVMGTPGAKEAARLAAIAGGIKGPDSE